MRDRHLLPEDRTLDVYFHEYMDDQPATLARVYEAAGIELTDQARAEHQAYIDSRPRGKDGRVVYDLRGDFDITPEEAREPFGFYFDRFPVRIEV